MPSRDITGNLAEYTISLQNRQVQIFAQAEKAKKKLPMFSTRAPERETARQLAGFSLREGMLAVVMGAAAIPLLRELIEMKRKNGGEILLFEADAALADQLKALLPEIYSQLNLVTADTGLNEFLKQLDVTALTGYRIISLPAARNLHPDYYKDKEQNFKKEFSSRFSDLFTRLEFEPRWIYNSIMNLRSLYKAAPVKYLRGKAGGRTAILVSTGPSLRDSLPLLKMLADSCFIACVDSAYRVLVRAGIKPDLVCTLDAQVFTLRHFGGIRQSNENMPALYADLVANPQVIRDWPGKLFFGVTAQYTGDTREVTPGCDFIEDYLNKGRHSEFFGDIQSGGSVATTLFDLLRLMRFKTIILTGQDLAYSHYEIHCMGTHHTDHWLNAKTSRLQTLESINFAVVKKRHTVMSESISGGRVPADYVLGLYRNWLENAIEVVSNEVINITTEGLPLRNTAELTDYRLNELKRHEKFRLKAEDIQVFPSSVQQRSDDLIRYIRETSFDNIDLKKAGFINRIGRKFNILAERKVSEDKNAYSELLEKQKTTQKAFWAMIQNDLS